MGGRLDLGIGASEVGAVLGGKDPVDSPELRAASTGSGP